jgi:hypothetical protein
MDHLSTRGLETSANSLKILLPATMRESVGLDSEHVIVDPGTRTRGAGALAMEDFDWSTLGDDRAGAVDSMGDKHTRFEEAGTG